MVPAGCQPVPWVARAGGDPERQPGPALRAGHDDPLTYEQALKAGNGNLRCPRFSATQDRLVLSPVKVVPPWTGPSSRRIWQLGLIHLH
jgi:hypothetical protein